MRATLPLIACVLSALVSAVPANAQSRDRVARIEIYNGATRTVNYVAPDLSPGEALSLREMERLENETGYLRDLSALKREYAASERQLEPYRRLVQQQLYGISISDTATSSFVSYPAGAWGRGGWGWAGGYGMGVPAVGGNTSAVTHSLANGMGDEGVMKSAMALAIAQQSTADYASTVDRAYDRAMARVSASPALRASLRLPERRESGSIRTAGSEEASPVVLTLKNGDKVRGTKMEEKGNWLVVTMPGNRTLRLRESEVVRIETAPSGGVAPAAKP